MGGARRLSLSVTPVQLQKGGGVEMQQFIRVMSLLGGRNV